MEIKTIIAYASNQGAFNQIFSLLSFLRIKATIYVSHGALSCRPLTTCEFITLKDINDFWTEILLPAHSTIIHAFIGLSSYSYTHELKFLAFCKKFNIRSSSIQDYPGFYGHFSNLSHPDTFLIPDTFHYPPDSQSDLKHLYVPNPYHLFLATDEKRTALIKSNIKKIHPSENALFMQPLQIPGISYNFQEFLNVIPSGMPYDVILHPEDYDNKYVYEYLPILKHSQFRVLSSQLDSLSCLASCVTLVTSYSTVALQLEDSFFPFSINCNQVHYLFAGDAIKKSFQSSTILHQPPSLKTIKTTLHTCIETFSNISSNIICDRPVSSHLFEPSMKLERLRSLVFSLFPD